MTTKYIFITTTGSSTFTVPSDFGALVSIEAIGGGGYGPWNPDSGGGGAYAISTNIHNIHMNQTLYCYVSAGGDTTGTWCSTSNAKPSSSTIGVNADSGNGLNGGLTANCIGTLSHAGGTGQSLWGGGGGGAAGPNGPGGNGGYANAALGAGGGGGGANAGSFAEGNGGNYSGNSPTTDVGGAGGVGYSGQLLYGGGTGGGPGYNGGPATAGGGGGGGGGAYNTIGGASAMLDLWYGSIYPDTSGTGTWAGPGGGGGGSAQVAGNVPASLYGGGNKQGILVFTYNTSNPILIGSDGSVTGKLKTILITNTSGSTFTVPSDFGALAAIHAIGPGGFGSQGGWARGAGGGAWAQSTAVTGLVKGATAYYHVGSPDTAQSSWFNATSNAEPTTSSQGVLAAGATFINIQTPGQGGNAAICIGTASYSGGTGGGGGGGFYGGGGGSAGPSGSGGAGGNSLNNGGDITGAGGGAANGGGNGVSCVTDLIGGNGGGASGYGIGSTGSTIATSATAGSGSGGGGANSTYTQGGNGAMLNLWYGSVYPNITGTGTWAGPGGGGGGSGGTNSSSGAGGNGGGYGSGGGGSLTSSNSAQGIVVFQYYTTVPITIGGGITFS